MYGLTNRRVHLYSGTACGRPPQGPQTDQARNTAPLLDGLPAGPWHAAGALGTNEQSRNRRVGVSLFCHT